MATMKRVSTQGKLSSLTAEQAFNAPATALPVSVQTKFLKEAHQLTRLTISSFGEDIATEVSKLSEEVLSQTTVSSMGEFGKGMTQIMILTQKVDPKKLGVEAGSFLGKIKSFFVQTKEQILSQFETVSKEIEKIETTLSTHIDAMATQNVFLEKMYGANVNEHRNLEAAIKALERMKTDEEEKLTRMEDLVDPKDGMAVQAVADQHDFIVKIDKRLDRLRRIQHVALLTAPEIRNLQNGNLSCIEKFQDIKTTTLPAWKKQLSLVILALKQKEEAELGNAIDDKTNEFFNNAADLSGQNRVAVAKLSQRSVLDMSTLEHMQQVLITSTREANEIAKTGAEDRTNAVKKLADMRTELKNEFNPASSIRGMQPVRVLK